MERRTLELKPEDLRLTVEPASLPVLSTSEVAPLEGILGQDRAVSSLRLGLEMQDSGFNIYVSGPPGIGKMTTVRGFLETMAREKPVPTDWCYVNNFEDPYQPRVLCLPAGRGRQLQQGAKDLLEHLKTEIPKTFESEEYVSRRKEITGALEAQRSQVTEHFSQTAASAGFSLQLTPLGVVILPVLGNRILNDEEFQTLPSASRAEFQKKRENLQGELEAASKKIRLIEREMQDKLQALDRSVLLYIVHRFLDELTEKFKDLPEVIDHFHSLENAILSDISNFRNERTADASPLTAMVDRELHYRRYQVNVVVDNSRAEGGPVIVEMNPSYVSLFGRVEKESQLGALHTDFTLIKAGSIHKANGGYLVLQVEDLLRNPFSYDALKRTLKAKQIEIEDLGDKLGFSTGKGLRPQPIPLNIKVVLVGPPLLHHILLNYDQDYAELFKVKADFDTRMDRTPENTLGFLGFLSAFCKKENTRHMDRGAIALVLEYASRLAEDRQKLSTHFGILGDIIREADYWARKEGKEQIAAPHLQKALDQHVYRSNLIQEKIQEAMRRGWILIDVFGERVGQVNGLSVISLGDYEFGRPSRITATVAPGREGVVDIEREVELGGPIHSKGVLILNGYLAQRFAQSQPLSLTARVVFEQSYEAVEGDSASSTELYALLSALSGLPVRQSIAVTGSVNQHGEVQAIGGVNQKIEGFYELCKIKGLTGDQGVVIPKANVQNLMLQPEVVLAVGEKKFHIWAVEHVDEGIEILTGIPAGRRSDEGAPFPPASVNGLIEQRLKAFAEVLKPSEDRKQKELAAVH